MRRFFVFFLPFASLAFGGCAVYGPEELDRLTHEDPVFKQMIASRDDARAQIRAIKNDLLNRKQILDGEVDKLRREYDVYAKAQNQKIEKYLGVIEADRHLIEEDLESARNALDTKEREYARLERALEEINRVWRDTKEIVLSAAEKARWQERAMQMTEKLKPLTDEIQQLKAKITLNKRKIAFLK